MKENLVITVSDDISENIQETSFQTEIEFYSYLNRFLKKRKAGSTGNQYGCGCSEYFFSVQPGDLKSLRDELEKKMKSEGIDDLVTIQTY